MATALLATETPAECESNNTSPCGIMKHGLPHIIVTSSVLGVIILLTIIGNVFVVAAVVVDRHLHNVANYLVASLAIADLMVASLVMPIAAMREVVTHWFLGRLVCDIWISVDVICCTSSILHLVAISVDRYWAVTRVDYIRNRSHRRTIAMVGIIWVISVSISIPPLFGWKDQDIQPGDCIISQDWGYTVYSTFGAFYLPLAVIIIFYAKIFQAARARIRKEPFRSRRHLRKSMFNAATSTDYESTFVAAEIAEDMATVIAPVKHYNGTVSAANDETSASTTTALVTPRNNGGGVGITLPAQIHHRREKLEQQRERKAARTLAIITGAFVFCWLPFFVLAVLRPFCGSYCTYPDLLVSFINWLGYFNSLMNPVIYTVFNADFRKAFRKILFRR